MDTSYVPLRLRSNWSLLLGGSRLEAYLERAVRLGISALALTDGNLFGAVPFFEAAARFGVRPILGATVEITGPAGVGDAVLLVRDEVGYANLCRILSSRDLDGEPRVRDHAEGLFLITRDVRLAGAMRGAFEGRVFLDVTSNPNYRGDLPVVAAPEVLYARPEDGEVQRLLSAFRLGKTLDGMPPSDGRVCLRAPREMGRVFRHAPEALSNTVRIAEQCRFDLLDREVVFPRVAGEDGPLILSKRTLAGVRRRYGEITAAVQARLERELEMIIRMGFADYFLAVEEIVRHARSLGTPTAGRGSGAGSLVAYALGITNVDPMKYGLCFERFLNPGREDYPDLDVDFCWRLRDDVIEYAFERFGRERVAMIATYATFGPRMALRETGKAFGLSNPVITEIARKLRQGLPREKFDTLPADPGVVERVLDLGKGIQGFPHHLSVHCGGVVITPGAVASHAPLLRAEKGVVITAFDKDGVERIGLVKLDLLGNRSLSTVSEAVRHIEARTGKRLDPEALPEDSERTFAMIRAGRTVGVGQLESPAMRHLQMQMAPERILHLMQALALIRPGAAGEGMKEAFVKRKRGAEPVPSLAAPLKEVLGEAYGVMLYEDDAMQIAICVAGLEPGEANRFRKAITKGSPDAGQLEQYFAGCRRQGLGREEAEALLKQMAKFKSYSFCRAHAASYGQLAYSAAWLKAHYPLEYWTAALNNNEGMYPRWVLVEEAKRGGVRMLPPCVNRSWEEFAPEGDAVRCGLFSIASLSAGTVERILRLRPFASLEELVARVRPREAETEVLIRSGAFDFTGLARNRLLWKVMTSYKKMRACVPAVHEGGLGFEVGVPAEIEDDAPALALPEPDASQLWRDEWETTGFTCREHPMSLLREWLSRAGVMSSREIPRNVNRSVRLAGIIAAERRTRTERGELMQFLTFDDEDGVFEVVLFPDVYRKSRFLLDGPGPFLVEGRAESQHGAIAVRAVRLEGVG